MGNVVPGTGQNFLFDRDRDQNFLFDRDRDGIGTKNFFLTGTGTGPGPKKAGPAHVYI